MVAGLVSGTPKDSANLNVFPSEQISVRAMLVKQGAYDLLDALDAALVRVIERGGVEQLALKNAPYEALVVHSCKPDAGHFEWPALTNNSVITVASLGPYNWGGTDGDYTKIHIHSEQDMQRLWDQYGTDIYHTGDHNIVIVDHVGQW